MQYGRFFFMLLCACFSINAQANSPLYIACSSNFVPVLEALSKEYKTQKIILIQGASGKLTTQLSSGLPVDIFLSANKSFPIKLFKANKALKPFPYAIGELIFLVKKRPSETHILQYLAHHQQLIGMANPAFAPYGEQAMQFLESIDLWAPLKNKLIFGENINQTFQHMMSGNLNAAFITQAQWLGYSKLHPDDIKSYYAYRVPAPHNRVVQYGTIMTHSNKTDAAKDFVHYLLHNRKARQIINYSGYQAPKT